MVSGHDIWGYPDVKTPLPRTLAAMGERGWVVDFVTSEKPSFMDGASALYGEPPNDVGSNITIHRIRLPFNQRLWKIMGNYTISRRILERIKMELLFPRCIKTYVERFAAQADVIYGYEIYGVPIASKLAKKYKKVLITRFQGTFALKWIEDAEESLLWKISYFRYLIHWRAMRTKADLIIMTDDGTQGLKVLQKLGNNSPTRFWRNGCDFFPSGRSMQDLRNSLGLPKEVPITISISRLVYWKRVDRIIRAMPYILKEVPDLIHIVIGDGEYRKELEEMAAELGVEKQILFLGTQPSNVVSDYMEAADIFLSFFDVSNVGNPLIEALRLGKPIITLNVGDTNKIIEDEINGILLQEDKPENIAKAVVRLLQDKKLIESIKEGALRTGNDIWTWDQRLNAELSEIESKLRAKS